MTTLDFIWIGLLALLMFWAVGAYNRLVRLKNAIAAAFGPVDVQLKSREALVTQLIEAAATSPHIDAALLYALLLANAQVLSAQDAVRSRPGKAKSVCALATAEDALTARLTPLLAATANSLDAMADEAAQALCVTLTEALAGAQNQVTFARQTYNDAVRDYNEAQSEFPAVLLAGLFGFYPAARL